ncbi:MAG: hypothetical protein ACXVIY_03130 [Mucilaginibacter sp.]
MSSASNRPVITFSWNWNAKLFCKCFTTIRIHNPGKYVIGRSYDIRLNDHDMGTGIIRTISQFRLDQFNDNMALIDMGMPAAKAKATLLTMYKNKNFNWDTQLFDFILIEQPDKVLLIPDELFGHYVDAENEDGKVFLHKWEKAEQKVE